MSFLEAYITTPVDTPSQMAKYIYRQTYEEIRGCCINDLSAHNAAKKSCTISATLFLKQGLVKPLGKYQIAYWNEVIKEIDKIEINTN